MEVAADVVEAQSDCILDGSTIFMRLRAHCESEELCGGLCRKQYLHGRREIHGKRCEAVVRLQTQAGKTRELRVRIGDFELAK